MWQAWFNLAVGIWLVICGFIPGLQTPVSMLVPGAVAFIFGFWSTYTDKSWQGIVNGVSGIWLFLSAVWFGLFIQWNFLVFGVLIGIMALWNITEHPHRAHHATAQ